MPNDVSLAPTRKVYRLIRAISPSGVLASTFSRVSLRCRLAWKSESVVMLRAVASCSESKPKHQSSRLSFSEAVNVARSRPSTLLGPERKETSSAQVSIRRDKESSAATDSPDRLTEWARFPRRVGPLAPQDNDHSSPCARSSSQHGRRRQET